MKKYDLIVIGSGPAGEKAAVKAGYFGYKVALVEKEKKYGGAGVNTGTVPSKTLKETALYYSGRKDKGIYGVERELQHKATIEDFMFHKNRVVALQDAEVEKNLKIHGIDLYAGIASFEDSHTIRIAGAQTELIQGEFIIIASGSYPYHPPEIPFDGKRVHDSDTILDISRFPKSMCILGAGVIGCEYATIFSAMGIKVYLVNNHNKILPFLDSEIAQALKYQMAEDGIDILFDNSIESIQVPTDPNKPLTIPLKAGLPLEVDMFLYAAGRNGNIKPLNLEKIGIQTSKRETIVVDSSYRTNVPHIFAVGDVIGFPALASTSMDQGRVAVAHIFKTGDLEHIAKVFPYGIYTIPEVSTVGVTEDQAKADGLNTMTGVARYSDTARGQIMGVKNGILKLVFNKDDLVVRGVHIIGPLATELIHYGMGLVENERSLRHVIGQIFNYPTLHDLYKSAAYDGLGNVAGHKIKI